MSNAEPTSRLSFFGATDDTPNLGVSALFKSVIQSVLQRLPAAHLTAFDNSYGLRNRTIEVDGATRNFDCFGARTSKRFYRYDSLPTLRFCCKLGGLGNPGARAILQSSALLDISGGDSFTDLYGPKRYQWTVLPKRIAIENRIPLILLPQTYGPFRSEQLRKDAMELTKGARMAWARDVHSYERLKELLEDDFDPERHRCGVDVAFKLEPRDPGDALAPDLSDWIAAKPTCGLNVSGLIYASQDEARDRYGFRANYRQTVIDIVRRLCESGARVLLVPHVGDGARSMRLDTDLGACRDVFEQLGESAGGELRILEGNFGADQIKHVIARLDWFSGTRMHATIAGLSSCVPTSTIAYSDKAQGVFESCGQGDTLVDPRCLDTDEVVERIMFSWTEREQLRASLKVRIPEVVKLADAQMDLIARACQS